MSDKVFMMKNSGELVVIKKCAKGFLATWELGGFEYAVLLSEETLASQAIFLSDL